MDVLDHHEANEVRCICMGVEGCFDEPAQGLNRREVPDLQHVFALAQGGVDTLEDGAIQALLVAEIIIDHLLRRGGLLRDLVDIGTGKTVCGELLRRDRQDVFPNRLGILLPGRLTLLSRFLAAAKEIQGIIQWGAGGSTDTVMRSVTPHAEEALGGTVVLQNMTGAAGAIALNHVAAADADGYTLLMGAENPLLYKVMGLGDKDYSEFTPINILARGTPILVANNNAPFDDYTGMMDYITANPGELRVGSTGPGGLPSVVTAMMNTVEGEMDVTSVPYDGDGPALTAL